jgi:hypothetical protein
MTPNGVRLGGATMAAKSKAKRPAHRPSEYDTKAPALLEAIATTAKGMHRLHREDPAKYPHPRTVLRWLNEREDFRAQYACAKDAQAELIGMDCIAIADDSSRDFAIDPKTGAAVFDHENATRSKLRVDARKWVAARLAPRKWGDKTQHEVSGPDGGAVPAAIRVEYVESE